MSTFSNWLNKEFFIDIFEKEFNWHRDEFNVAIDFVRPTGGCGENYTSNLYKVQVCGIPVDGGECQTLRLFIKSMITSLGDLGLFQPEVDTYLKVLPALDDMWKSAGVEIKFGPKCYKVYKMEEREVIVMEDLAAKNYTVLNRFEGLNMEHAEIFLKKLAQFHAASNAHMKKHGLIENISKRFITPANEDFFRESCTLMFDSNLEALKNCDFAEKYISKLNKWTNRTYDLVHDATNYEEGEFSAFCHSDVWINNFMFGYRNGHPSNVIFIDFQTPFYGSPVFDVLLFIITSTSVDIKVSHFDKMIECYRENLVNSLVILDCPEEMFSLRDYHISVLKNMSILPFCFMLLAVVLADKDENANMAVIIDTTEKGIEFRRKMYNNPRFLQHMKVLLPFLDERGFLDI